MPTEPLDSSRRAPEVQPAELDLDQLYSTHRRIAHALAYGITRDHGLAADAVQEAFLVLWQAWHAFDATRGSVTSWLFTIVRRRAVDQVRRAVRQRTLAGLAYDLHAPSRHVPDHSAAVDQAGLVSDALGRLAPAEQHVLLLFYFADHSQAEIARLLDIPLGTVKARLARALPKLRQLLNSDEARST